MSEAPTTVVGSSGFIGSHLAAQLRRSGLVVNTPARGDDLSHLGGGTLYYCAGMTGDFLARPLDTADAQVSHLARVLRQARPDVVVYLSSTRLYGHGTDPAREDEPVRIDSSDPSHLYNATKLAGEALALCAAPRAHVARLSHVYPARSGSPNLLSQMVQMAQRGRVELRSDPASARDYVHVEDVCDLLRWVAADGQDPVYNLASGQQVSTAEVLAALAETLDFVVDVADGAPVARQRPIDVGLLAARGAPDSRHGLLDHLRRHGRDFGSPDVIQVDSGRG